MVSLAPASTTTITKVFNAVSSTLTTDTLFVQSVSIAFDSGVVSAIIQRGTLVNGVFEANMPSLVIDVRPDGSFRSQDGTWSGVIPNWMPTTLKSLSAPYDNLLLGVGLVQGSAI